MLIWKPIFVWLLLKFDAGGGIKIGSYVIYQITYTFFIEIFFRKFNPIPLSLFSYRKLDQLATIRSIYDTNFQFETFTLFTLTWSSIEIRENTIRQFISSMKSYVKVSNKNQLSAFFVPIKFARTKFSLG